jgi:hypothetical protein
MAPMAYAALQDLIPDEDRAMSAGLDEIDQIRKMVEEVSEIPPTFFTTA